MVAATFMPMFRDLFTDFDGLFYSDPNNFGRLFLILPIGYFLIGNQRRKDAFLIAALVGVSIPVITSIDRELFDKILSGKRPSFGYANAQHSSMLFSLAYIGLLSYYRKIAPRGVLWRQFAWFTISLVPILVISTSKTRGALLGLFTSGVLYCIHKLGDFEYRRIFSIIRERLQQPSPNSSGERADNFQQKTDTTSNLTALFLNRRFAPDSLWTRLKRNLIPYFSIVLLIVLFVLSTSHRMLPDVDSDPNGIATTSVQTNSNVGIRFAYWAEGKQLFCEHPLVGWGGDARYFLIPQASHLPYSGSIKHFHSSYVDFAVAYGLFGVMVILTPWIFAFRFTRRLRHSSSASDPTLNFTTYGIVCFGVMNFFESYIFNYWTGAFAAIILLAPIYSTWLDLIKSKSLSEASNSKTEGSD